MRYIADLHVHSHYSRATSKNLNLESLWKWARIKGIHVVGTGDFTHPEWFAELKQKLVPDGNGFFRLKDPPADEKGFTTTDIDVRFCLTTEISSIYKYGDRVRKNHNLVFSPDLDTVARINHKLSAIGNLKADGRPILGLPSRDLLEIVLETSDDAHLIPAHVWTPWFSTLGSKAGYDSIEACFRDLTGHIFALETGLSSDPLMNRKLSALDRFTLVSNSDAHSPAKLGREANLLDTDRSYDAMFEAFKTGDGFLGTYEFYPEEGKYHHDGHRKCNISLDPKATRSYQNICPVCGNPLTVGVLHRVGELADREKSAHNGEDSGFSYLIPLPEVLSEIEGTGPNSKKVFKRFRDVISLFGNEFDLLHRVPVEEVQRKGGTVLAEAVRRIRNNEVEPVPGYDGVYGVISVFEDGEVERIRGQLGFFGLGEYKTEPVLLAAEPAVEYLPGKSKKEKEETFFGLNEEQEAVRQSTDGATLVTAGPGTGKTHTLIEWILHQIETVQAEPHRVLAVTFTNKAADELKERLEKRIGKKAREITVSTFHSLAWQLLREWFPDLNNIYDASVRRMALRILVPQLKTSEIGRLSDRIAGYMDLNQPLAPDEEEVFFGYEAWLREQNAVDLSGLIRRAAEAAPANPERLRQLQERYMSVAVDEFQDLNPMQYEMVRLVGHKANLLAIGDPDQAIYGFRGSDVRFFFRFSKEWKARGIALRKNYRSTGTILDAAKSVIAKNTLRSEAPLVSNQKKGSRITVYHAPGPAGEAGFILDQIEKYVGGIDSLAGGAHTDSGHSYGFGDIAVLFRTNAIGETLFKSFLKAGIPVHFGDGTAFLAGPPFSVIAGVLKLHLEPDDHIRLGDLLAEAYGWKPEQVRSLLESLHRNPVPLWGDGHPPLSPPSSSSGQALNRPQRDKGEFPGIAGSLREDLDGLRNLMKKIGKVLPVQRSGGSGKSVKNAVEMICSRYLSEETLSGAQLLKKETLLELAEESGDDPERFLEQMQLNPYTDAGRLKSQGVQLLSFHAAKGLEFPVVFIAGAEEGITPLLREDSNIEEERRLFYVAMTRAKKELQITHVTERVRYGKKEAMKPSRFIAEIPEMYKTVAKPEVGGSSSVKEKERVRQLGLF